MSVLCGKENERIKVGATANLFIAVGITIDAWPEQ